MPHGQSQILKTDGKAWQTLSRLVSAIHDVGGNDDHCKPLWSSEELAANIAAVLMGRMKFVICSLQELAASATLEQDRRTAIRQLHPQDDRDCLLAIALNARQAPGIRVEAINRCDPSTELIALANSSDVAMVAHAAVHRLSKNMIFLDVVAGSAILESTRIEAINKLGEEELQLAADDILARHVEQQASLRLANLAFQRIRGDELRQSLQAKPHIRFKIEAFKREAQI